MRIVQKRICVVVAMILLLSSTAFAAEPQMETVELSDTPYVFAVKPGTTEWENLSPAERRRISHVPREEVENMTTRALLETVLNYPYLVDIYAFNSIEEGIEIVADRCPALRELLLREDVGEWLCLFASAAANQRNTVTTDEMRNYYLYRLSAYVGDSEAIQAAATARATTTYVTTPNGSSVLVKANMTWSDHGLTKSETERAMDDLLDTYSSAELLRDVSPAYNCHSYAWYSTSSSNPYWMNDPSAYITDGSYEEGYAVRNARVTYSQGNSIIHSGIVSTAASSSGTANDAVIKSKWGVAGLVSHDLLDCPYYDPEYYTGVSIDYWEQ